ncbi:hypothetical protein [Mesorhizobium sp.]|uniref:hypothetical protein n=1 Tax=Mesorhizobium sp. TaxID=1871066 RepID=UPI00257C83B3|nr:hypothetical protein [Mesorhizobium sp.]
MGPCSEFRESNEFGFFKHTIVDTDPDGSSLDDEINHLQTELFNIAESHGPTFARSAVSNDPGDRRIFRVHMATVGRIGAEIRPEVANRLCQLAVFAATYAMM